MTPPPASTTTELLLAWLAYLRGAVLRDLAGLTDRQARWRRHGALISVIGIVNQGETARVVRALPLDAPCHRREGKDLRWVLLPLINETARHAGHPDATRELLDVATGE